MINITGIEAMETQAIDQFLRMAQSVRLFRSDCAFSGVHLKVTHGEWS
jgi:hypothetical protein